MLVMTVSERRQSTCTTPRPKLCYLGLAPEVLAANFSYSPTLVKARSCSPILAIQFPPPTLLSITSSKRPRRNTHQMRPTDRTFRCLLRWQISWWAASHIALSNHQFHPTSTPVPLTKYHPCKVSLAFCSREQAFRCELPLAQLSLILMIPCNIASTLQASTLVIITVQWSSAC